MSECYRRVFQLYIFQSTATQPHLESIPWNLHTNLGIFVEWNICPHNPIKSKRGGLTKIMEPQSNFKKMVATLVKYTQISQISCDFSSYLLLLLQPGKQKYLRNPSLSLWLIYPIPPWAWYRPHLPHLKPPTFHQPIFHESQHVACCPLFSWFVAE